MAASQPSTVELDPNGYDLILRFGYDKMLVEEIKTELPRRRWDPGAKAWRVPAKDIDQVYSLCLKHGFEFSSDVSGLMAGTIVAKDPPKAEPKAEPKADAAAKTGEPKQKNDTKRALLDSDGQHLLLSFPYDEAMVAAVKELPERRWDRKAKQWRVPVTCAGLPGFLGEHEFELDDAATAALPDSETGESADA